MKFEDKVKGLREKKYKGRETPEFLSDVVLMAQGEAYEYLLGSVAFCNAKVDLSLRPMIPRPETEFWVSGVLDELRKKKDLRKEQQVPSQGNEVFSALDLFAGSGCVGLAVLKNLPESHVTFVELDTKSKEQITLSLLKNNIETERGIVVTEDCVEFLGKSSTSKKFDAIFAVPPYVPKEMEEEVMRELHNEEPLFFFDKEDGYYFHTQIVLYAKKFLKEEGVLYLEFDITQREKIEELIKHSECSRYSFRNDPYGHECVVVVTY